MMRVLLHMVFGFLSFLASEALLAQVKYSIVNYNTDNGLPQNTVKDFHFDGAGFLWVATEDGLMRYDGTLFRLFSSPNPGTLNNRIVSLNYSMDGRLFVTDINSQVEEIKDGKLLVVEKGRLGQMPDLDQILGTQLPYPLFEKVKKSHFLDRKNDNNNIIGLVPLKENRWALVSNKSMDVYNDTTLILSIGYPSSGSYKVIKLQNQVIAFNPNTGFFSLDLFGRKWVRLKNETGISNLQAVNIVWDNQQPLAAMVDNKHVYTLATKTNRIQAALFIDSLASTSKVTRVEYNPAWNIVVVGTESEGLFIYRNVSFRQMADHKFNRPYYGQYPLSSGSVMTNTGDIIGTEPPGKVKPFTHSFNNYIISGQDQNVYYASGDTVYQYNERIATTKRVFVSRGSQNFVLDYHLDTLWMINSNGIFFRTGDSNYISRLFPANLNNLAYAIERTSPATFLYGNCLGLFSYHPANRKVDTLLWMPQKCIRTLWRYGDKIFIGTYGDGWKVWDGKRIINMPLDRNQYLLYAHCFILDRNNFLWIPTNRGLFKYYMPDVEHYIAGRTASLYYYHYGKAEGIVNTEFNGGCYPCAVQLQNGYTSLPNLGGLVWFKPEETTHPLPATAIVFDKLELNNKPIKMVGSTLSLPADVRIFRIEIGIPFFGSDLNNQVEYRTIGVDATWKLLSRINPVVRYTTLPAGHFRLEIRRAGGFSKPYFTKTLEFTVAPPWYLTTVAIIGWVLLLVIIVALIVRIQVAQYRRRQIVLEQLVEQKVTELRSVNKKLEQNVQMLEGYQQELLKRDTQKSRFIKIMSHDLVGPLRFIKMVTTQIEKQKEQTDKESLLEILSEIQDTADDLLVLCADLLSWSTYEKGEMLLTHDYFNLYAVVEEKVDSFRRAAAAKNLKLLNHCPESLYIKNDKNVIKIILQNLISNALKFTKEGEVNVFAGHYDNHYYLGVNDTGTGMSSQQAHELLHNNILNSTLDTENKKGHGVGFLIIRELAVATKGVISIQSTPGKGTTITIEWPEGTPLYTAATASSEAFSSS